MRTLGVIRPDDPKQRVFGRTCVWVKRDDVDGFNVNLLVGPGSADMRRQEVEELIGALQATLEDS